MRLKRRSRERREYSDSCLVQLACGSDIFGDAFGDDREAMREAWQIQEVREAAYQRLATDRKKGIRQIRPWAFWAFALPQHIIMDPFPGLGMDSAWQEEARVLKELGLLTKEDQAWIWRWEEEDRQKAEQTGRPAVDLEEEPLEDGDSVDTL